MALPVPNSATGGYLLPQTPPAAPLEDNALEDFLQSVVAGVTGLSGKVIFPRWQPDVPNQPNFPDSWAAFGITDYDPDIYAWINHDPTANAGQGADQMWRNEVLTMLLSFYGPNAGTYAALFRDGMQIAQNREPLFLAGMAHIEAGQTRAVPSLAKNRWVKRMDVVWRVKRVVPRDYPVLHILSATAGIYTDAGIGPVQINVEPPPL